MIVILSTYRRSPMYRRWWLNYIITKRSSDIVNLLLMVATYDWDCMYFSSSLDRKIAVFNFPILDLHERSVPFRHMTPHGDINDLAPWFNGENRRPVFEWKYIARLDAPQSIWGWLFCISWLIRQDIKLLTYEVSWIRVQCLLALIELVFFRKLLVILTFMLIGRILIHRFSLELWIL